MRKFLLLLPLLLCTACGPDKLVTTSQFKLDSYSHLICPKCGCTPRSMAYKSEQDSTSDGANDHDHMQLTCRQCDFTGWATCEDTKAAIRAQEGH